MGLLDDLIDQAAADQEPDAPLKTPVASPAQTSEGLLDRFIGQVAEYNTVISQLPIDTRTAGALKDLNEIRGQDVEDPNATRDPGLLSRIGKRGVGVAEGILPIAQGMDALQKMRVAAAGGDLVMAVEALRELKDAARWSVTPTAMESAGKLGSVLEAIPVSGVPFFVWDEAFGILGESITGLTLQQKEKLLESASKKRQLAGALVARAAPNVTIGSGVPGVPDIPVGEIATYTLEQFGVDPDTIWGAISPYTPQAAALAGLSFDEQRAEFARGTQIGGSSVTGLGGAKQMGKRLLMRGPTGVKPTAKVISELKETKEVLAAADDAESALAQMLNRETPAEALVDELDDLTSGWGGPMAMRSEEASMGYQRLVDVDRAMNQGVPINPGIMDEIKAFESLEELQQSVGRLSREMGENLDIGPGIEIFARNRPAPLDVGVRNKLAKRHIGSVKQSIVRAAREIIGDAKKEYVRPLQGGRRHTPAKQARRKVEIVQAYTRFIDRVNRVTQGKYADHLMNIQLDASRAIKSKVLKRKYDEALSKLTLEELEDVHRSIPGTHTKLPEPPSAWTPKQLEGFKDIGKNPLMPISDPQALMQPSDIFGGEVVARWEEARFALAIEKEGGGLLGKLATEPERILKPFLKGGKKSASARVRVLAWRETKGAERAALEKQMSFFEVEAAKELSVWFDDMHKWSVKHKFLRPEQFLKDYIPKYIKPEAFGRRSGAANVAGEIRWESRLTRDPNLIVDPGIREMDAARVIDRYLGGLTREMHMEPARREIIATLRAKLPSNSMRKEAAFEWLGDQLGSKRYEQGWDNLYSNVIGNFMSDIGARPAHRVGKAITDYIYLSGMGFRPRSAIRNLSQSMLTIGEVGWKAYGKGVTDAARAYDGAGPLRQLLERQTFRRGAYAPGLEHETASMLRSWYPNLRDKSMWMFKKADRANRVLAFFSGRAKAMHIGKKFKIGDKQMTRFLDSVRPYERELMADAIKRGNVEKAGEVYGNYVQGLTQYKYGTADTAQFFRHHPILKQFGTWPVEFARMQSRWWAGAGGPWTERGIPMMKRVTRLAQKSGRFAWKNARGPMMPVAIHKLGEVLAENDLIYTAEEFSQLTGIPVPDIKRYTPYATLEGWLEHGVTTPLESSPVGRMALDFYDVFSYGAQRAGQIAGMKAPDPEKLDEAMTRMDMTLFMFVGGLAVGDIVKTIADIDSGVPVAQAVTERWAYYNRRYGRKYEAMQDRNEYFARRSRRKKSKRKSNVQKLIDTPGTAVDLFSEGGGP